MGIFYILLLVILFVCPMINIFSKKYKILSNILFWMIVGLIVLISGLRNNIGDTEAYIHLYKAVADRQQIEGYEKGFLIIFELLNRISTDPQFMLISTSLVINILNLVTLKIYSSDIFISSYLYITSGCYFVTMNGIRQCLAAGLIFIATRFVQKGNFIKYTLIIILASTIHISALIMIPFYFVVRCESWSKKIGILISVTICMLFLYPYLEKILFSLVGEKYSTYKNFNEGGANIFRILVSLVPVILAYIKKDYIKGHWKNGNIFINMSILNFIIMSFAYYNWIFARFCVYTELYSIIVLSYIISRCFEKKERRIIIYALIVLYFIYFWYDNSFIMGIQYKSNILGI